MKNIIKYLKEFDNSAGLTKVELAKIFDLLVSTLKTIMYDRDKINYRAAACGNSSLKKICVQQGKFLEVEDTL